MQKKRRADTLRNQPHILPSPTCRNGARGVSAESAIAELEHVPTQRRTPREFRKQATSGLHAAIPPRLSVYHVMASSASSRTPLAPRNSPDCTNLPQYVPQRVTHARAV